MLWPHRPHQSCFLQPEVPQPLPSGVLPAHAFMCRHPTYLLTCNSFFLVPPFWVLIRNTISIITDTPVSLKHFPSESEGKQECLKQLELSFLSTVPYIQTEAEYRGRQKEVYSVSMQNTVYSCIIIALFSIRSTVNPLLPFLICVGCPRVVIVPLLPPHQTSLVLPELFPALTLINHFL